MQRVVVLSLGMGKFDVPLVVIVFSDDTQEFIEECAAVLLSRKQVQLFLDSRKDRTNRTRPVDGPFPEESWTGSLSAAE